MTPFNSKTLLSVFLFALKGVNPLTGKRLHPFQRRAIALNCLLAAIGCLKLAAQLCLSREQQRWLRVVLDVSLAVAGFALAMQIREWLLLRLQRQEGDRL